MVWPLCIFLTPPHTSLPLHPLTTLAFLLFVPEVTQQVTQACLYSVFVPVVPSTYNVLSMPGVY